MMRYASLLPVLLMLGLTGCVVATPAPATTTYVTPAPAPTTTYVTPAPTAAYVTPVAPATTTVIGP